MRKSKKDEIEKLQKQKMDICNRIDEIETKEIERIQKPRLRAMVGRCFVYRKNCYWCPEKPSDYWPVFRKIMDCLDMQDGSFYFLIEEFQIDIRGEVTFKTKRDMPYLNKEWWDNDLPFSGYVVISDKEYDAAKANIILEMANQTKMRRVLKSEANTRKKARKA